MLHVHKLCRVYASQHIPFRASREPGQERSVWLGFAGNAGDVVVKKKKTTDIECMHVGMLHDSRKSSRIEHEHRPVKHTQREGDRQDGISSACDAFDTYGWSRA